jgi:hypothetical protein
MIKSRSLFTICATICMLFVLALVMGAMAHHSSAAKATAFDGKSLTNGDDGNVRLAYAPPPPDDTDDDGGNVRFAYAPPPPDDTDDDGGNVRVAYAPPPPDDTDDDGGNVLVAKL